VYLLYRPGYPPAVIDFLRRELGLTSSSVVADVGSGTGKLSGMLAVECGLVFGVEPNREMRRAAESLLGELHSFRSIDGTAEATGLQAGSVDLVTAAQAFHWFRPEEARREFSRILKAGGHVALIWNRRRTEESAFLQAYEELLLRRGVDYAAVDHRRRSNPAVLDAFFAPGRYSNAAFPNEQELDWDGLRGRTLSASYVPMAGKPGHEPLMRGLREIFDRHQTDGVVRMEYSTELYCGRLDGEVR
jgi:SAM-dependent methyltransferase